MQCAPSRHVKPVQSPCASSCAGAAQSKPCGTVQADTDFFGADLHTCPQQGIDCAFPRTASLAACCELCRAKAGCGSYTFKVEGSVCHLKEATGFSAFARDGYHSAVMPVPTGVTSLVAWRIHAAASQNAAAATDQLRCARLVAHWCLLRILETLCISLTSHVNLPLSQHSLQWRGCPWLHHRHQRHHVLLCRTRLEMCDCQRREHRCLHEATHPGRCTHCWRHRYISWRRCDHRCGPGNQRCGLQWGWRWAQPCLLHVCILLNRASAPGLAVLQAFTLPAVRCLLLTLYCTRAAPSCEPFQGDTQRNWGR